MRQSVISGLVEALSDWTVKEMSAKPSHRGEVGSTLSMKAKL